MPDLNVKIGQTIETQDKKQGTVRYIGPLHIAAGEWLGLELADSSGKNDGSVKGERYFECTFGHGIFVRKESAARILRQQPQTTRPAGAPMSNGVAAKSRPSSVIPADVARKRQSLMSAGSGSTVGSRLSLRVCLPLCTLPYIPLTCPLLVPYKVTNQAGPIFCQLIYFDTADWHSSNHCTNV